MTWRLSLSLFAGLALLVGLIYADAPAPPKDGPAPAVTVAEPVTHGNLTVFFLRGKDTIPAGHTFLTLQEAIEQKKLVVHETGTVNELSVENVSPDVDVFIQTGDIVRGGRQDRLMAMDMVVPPKSGKLPIASFCCESGRWQQRGRESAGEFNKSDKQAANKDVKLAISGGRDQGQVWEKVKQAQMKLSKNVGKPVADAASPSSYQLTLEDKDLLAKIEAYVKAIKPSIEGKDDVIGFVIAINGKVEGAEVYGSAALFRKLWPKLVEGAATDALAEFQKDKKFDACTAKGCEKFLADAEKGKRSEVAAKPADERGRGPGRANADRQQAANPNVGGPPTHGAPAVAAKIGRVRNFACDSDKSLMLECQDAKVGNAVLHRSYIAK